MRWCLIWLFVLAREFFPGPKESCKDILISFSFLFIFENLGQSENWVLICLFENPLVLPSFFTFFSTKIFFDIFLDFVKFMFEFEVDFTCDFFWKFVLAIVCPISAFRGFLPISSSANQTHLFRPDNLDETSSPFGVTGAFFMLLSKVLYLRYLANSSSWDVRKWFKHWISKLRDFDLWSIGFNLILATRLTATGEFGCFSSRE